MTKEETAAWKKVVKAPRAKRLYALATFLCMVERESNVNVAQQLNVLGIALENGDATALRRYRK